MLPLTTVIVLSPFFHETLLQKLNKQQKVSFLGVIDYAEKVCLFIMECSVSS